MTTETSSRVRLTLQFDGQVEDAEVRGIAAAALLAVEHAYDAVGHLVLPGARLHEVHVDLDEDSGERVLG